MSAADDSGAVPYCFDVAGFTRAPSLRVVEAGGTLYFNPPKFEDSRKSHLATALAAAYGHAVHLNVVLDPQVVGGMSVRIGDELINGSVASRLAELRRGLAA